MPGNGARLFHHPNGLSSPWWVDQLYNWTVNSFMALVAIILKKLHFLQSPPLVSWFISHRTSWCYLTGTLAHQHLAIARGYHSSQFEALAGNQAVEHAESESTGCGHWQLIRSWILAENVMLNQMIVDKLQRVLRIMVKVELVKEWLMMGITKLRISHENSITERSGHGYRCRADYWLRQAADGARAENWQLMDVYRSS